MSLMMSAGSMSESKLDRVELLAMRFASFQGMRSFFDTIPQSDNTWNHRCRKTSKLPYVSLLEACKRGTILALPFFGL